MNETLISAVDVSKSFGHTRAVREINLQVQAGEIYGLVGPDGAGKTTFLRLLCGVLHPDAGEIHLGKYNVITQADQAREMIGYLAQHFALYEELTVLENLRFHPEEEGGDEDEDEDVFEGGVALTVSVPIPARAKKADARPPKRRDM